MADKCDHLWRHIITGGKYLEECVVCRKTRPDPNPPKKVED